ncbi:hypothetical protein CDL15_Pgr001480 [Punica granatum]|uniref:Uncharacterized protein n=1 Tax=Punica granatum TaxID=22663 RepID=A0A218WL44_PUNGR|nr:hypothetical protein CDL15_Pgr001480 [Punica granatum]PKI42576.1 hypothetical protein CRG98_037021 [Punica granatum]
MEGVRMQLQFEDRRILSKSQRKEGLKRSWIRLKPQHETVCNLTSHILHAFELQDSCPHGLILSLIGRMVSGSAHPLPLIADSVPLLVRNPPPSRRSVAFGRGEAEKRLEPVKILLCSKEKTKLSLQSTEVTDE